MKLWFWLYGITDGVNNWVHFHLTCAEQREMNFDSRMAEAELDE